MDSAEYRQVDERIKSSAPCIWVDVIASSEMPSSCGWHSTAKNSLAVEHYEFVFGRYLFVFEEKVN